MNDCPPIDVREAPIAETRALRRAVLRPHQTVEQLAAEEAADTFAAGAWRGATLIAVGLIGPSRAAWLMARARHGDGARRARSRRGHARARRAAAPRTRARRCVRLVQRTHARARLLRARRLSCRVGGVRRAAHRTPRGDEQADLTGCLGAHAGSPREPRGRPRRVAALCCFAFTVGGADARARWPAERARAQPMRRKRR